MKKKITLNDIAKKLNITKVSVSKALRNHPDISEKRKKEIRKVANELGYRPNLIARSLTFSRTKTLGVVVPKIAHNFFANVVAGIQQFAKLHEYEILLTVSEEREDLERNHIESLVSMQVDGLLVSVSMETKSTEIYEWIRGMQIPLVFFDRIIPDLGFNAVLIDDKKAAKNGVTELINRGYSNIAHLAGYSHVNIGAKRREGYEEALINKGITPDPSLVVEGGFGEKSGYFGFKELISRGVKFDTLFAVTLPVGLGAFMAMREIDPSYIDKIKMMVFGDSGIRGIIPYPHYYVDQPGHAIGMKATEMLLKEIEGTINPENRIEFLKTDFFEAGSRFTTDSMVVKSQDQ